MKILVTISMVLALAASACASSDFGGVVAFSNISAASAAVKTSSAYYVGGYKMKTMHVSGVTLTSSPSSVTYKNMSGTLIAQCAPTSSGPWSTCVANGYAQTAASVTTNTSFTWTDVSNYIRLKWTSGTVGGKLKAWLNYISN